MKFTVLKCVVRWFLVYFSVFTEILYSLSPGHGRYPERNLVAAPDDSSFPAAPRQPRLYYLTPALIEFLGSVIPKVFLIMVNFEFT